MSEEKVRKLREKEEVKQEKTMLTNGDLEIFQRFTSAPQQARGVPQQLPILMRLAGLPLPPRSRQKVFSLITGINESVQMKAFLAQKQQLAQDFQDRKKKELDRLEALLKGNPRSEEEKDSNQKVVSLLDEAELRKISEQIEKLKGQELTFDAPEVQELFKLDSGLEFEQVVIPDEDVPREFTTIDQMVVARFIRFT